ncbi:hypothetical protein L7F22_067103 [Adiantum nelumboides]|nr:hypothetical protein [Adiantum nelumboides]
MMHSHTCKACSVHGRPATIFITAGEPQPVEDENNQQLVPSSMRSISLPLVVSTVGAAIANHHQQYMRHLVHPCGCMHRSTMHAENLYLHPHHHNVPLTLSHSASCLAGAHTSPHVDPPQVHTPEPLCCDMELVLACGNTHRKFGPDAYGVHAPALSNAKVIDVSPLSVCRSIAAVCVDKQLLPAQASKNMHVESLCCAAHMCSLPTLSQAHTDADASNERKQTVDRYQIHPHCVAPTTTISTFRGFSTPQAPPKAAVASPTCNNKVVIDHCKQGLSADHNGDQNGDDFWKGASNNQPGGDADDTSKGGRGSANGNRWRGGWNPRGKGSSHQTTTTWNASKDGNGGNNDPWDGADGGNGNSGRGRGRARGCGWGRGGCQQNKRKREGEDADWGGPKTNTCGDKSIVEGHGWGHSSNWEKPNNNSACNGW